MKWRCLLKLLIGCGAGLGLVAVAAEPALVREPAVAGLFYPKDPVELSRVIERQLAEGPASARPGLRALIVPHAGYAYSGPIAASGFRLLRGGDFQTVVLLAPSHTALLYAASVSPAELYRTPLGDVPISTKTRQLVKARPYELDPRCRVQRPAWAAQSSRLPPAAGEERADTWEHADEVEVPFLQKTLGRFTLVPVVVGEVNPAVAAQGLEPLLDEETLVVVSSDLSHYHGYSAAVERDRACIEAICALNTETMAEQEACGRTPILTLLHLAKRKGWKPELLDYRNSGDTAGDKSRVVGYAAIAFYESAAPMPAAEQGAPELPLADRSALLALARATVRAAAAGERTPEWTRQEASPRLAANAACFVTLTKRGQLRGCIGHLVAQAPLYRSVIENAQHAAIRDPRFLPVSPREVDELIIEISVLTEPAPLAFSSPEDLLAKLQPHRDGVILQLGARRATYLPQVWEQLPDKIEFLNSLAEKAGARRDDWRREGAAVFVYRVESFRETER